ncbi:flavin reductase family protein [Microbispora sp. ATCC PTA-5024]|uniref:flavin reductase family protein n=1 Tax=Microbispora sp. ATCC PTA-5024 TaxID=316330 RepID=UPI0003DCED84|nr:flavin reductase family protein [Microbispora sp. ATCC PTA-5024]ETK37566.1 flavin-dependent reductase [Microbispora sp. ATCC PTA-5024]
MSADAIEDGSPRDAFLSAFRRHAAGVAVVTTMSEHGPVGFTATSVTSVSREPPMLAFGIGTSSSCWPAIRDGHAFVVHILASGQRDLAALFARRGADRFGPHTRWSRLPGGEPLLHGAAAWLRCRTRERFIAGDHRLVLGLVTDGRADPELDPLVYHDGTYRILSGLDPRDLIGGADG